MRVVIGGILAGLILVAVIGSVADNYQQSRAETIRAKAMLVMAQTNHSQAKALQTVAVILAVAVVVVCVAWVTVTVNKPVPQVQVEKVIERYYTEKVVLYIPEGHSRREFYMALTKGRDTHYIEG